MEKSGFDWLHVLLVDDSVAILNYVSKILEQSFDINHVHTESSASETM